MFLPEELISYAVYSNPADFCQGKETHERWAGYTSPLQESRLIVGARCVSAVTKP